MNRASPRGRRMGDRHHAGWNGAPTCRCISGADRRYWIKAGTVGERETLWSGRAPASRASSCHLHSPLNRRFLPADRGDGSCGRAPRTRRGPVPAVARMACAAVPASVARRYEVVACAASRSRMLPFTAHNGVLLRHDVHPTTTSEYIATSRQYLAHWSGHVRLASFLWPWSRGICGPWNCGADALCAPAEIAPLTRVCRIAAAHWLGRI